MTLGLYKIGENQPITRIRRAGWASDHPAHFLPDSGGSPVGARTLCGLRLGREFQWNDAGESCKRCLTRIQAMVDDGELVAADPKVVAEFQRLMLARLGDRQADAATHVEARLAVEIYRPRDGVMGSAGTRREIHLTDCPIVSAVERPMVPLPVSEVLRLKNSDSEHVDCCPECQPSYVLDNERKRPKTLAEAQALAERVGYHTRDRVRRTTPSARHRNGFRLLPHDGSMHFDGCPADAEALLRGNVTDPGYGRCTCYDSDVAAQEDGLWRRYRQRHPLGRRRPLDPAPEWTL